MRIPSEINPPMTPSFLNAIISMVVADLSVIASHFFWPLWEMCSCILQMPRPPLQDTGCVRRIYRFFRYICYCFYKEINQHHCIFRCSNHLK